VNIGLAGSFAEAIAGRFALLGFERPGASLLLLRNRGSGPAKASSGATGRCESDLAEAEIGWPPEVNGAELDPASDDGDADDGGGAPDPVSEE